MKLKISWQAFHYQINDYIREADGILSVKEELKAVKSHEFILSTINNWIHKCYIFLKKAFDQPENVYAERFYSERPYIFYLAKSEIQSIDPFKDAFQNLSIKKNWLVYNLRLLSVCDDFIQTVSCNPEEKEHFDTAKIVDMLLEKLYELHDNFYYPIHTIIRGNGIKLKNNHEFSKILIKYESEGIIRLISNNSICGQLTQKGRIWVENKMKQNAGSITICPEVQTKIPVQIKSN